MSTAFIAPDGDPTSRERESRAEAVFRKARERREEEIRSALRQEIASGIRRDSAAMDSRSGPLLSTSQLGLRGGNGDERRPTDYKGPTGIYEYWEAHCDYPGCRRVSDRLEDTRHQEIEEAGFIVVLRAAGEFHFCPDHKRTEDRADLPTHRGGPGEGLY